MRNNAGYEQFDSCGAHFAGVQLLQQILSIAAEGPAVAEGNSEDYINITDETNVQLSDRDKGEAREAATLARYGDGLTGRGWVSAQEGGALTFTIASND